jgi:hypothetical protein
MELHPDAEIQDPEPTIAQEHAGELPRSIRRFIVVYGAAGLIWVSILAAVFGIAFLATNVWVASGPYVYGIIAPLILAIMFQPIRVPGFFFQQMQGEGINSAWQVRLGGVASLLFYILGTVAFIVDAGQFLRYWAINFGGFIAPKVTDYWAWVAYAAYWMLDNVFANVWQIFGWEHTTIHPATLVARFVVLDYNILLDVVIIAGIVQAIRWLGTGRY